MIRPYKITDLEAVLAAWENASKVGHPFLSEAFLAQERVDLRELYLPNTETWVFEQDGQVIGFISLMGNEIGGLFVQPAFHGTGVGRQLMEKAKSLHPVLELEVFKSNSVGRRFYAKCGFVLISEGVHEETQQTFLRLRFTAPRVP